MQQTHQNKFLIDRQSDKWFISFRKFSLSLGWLSRFPRFFLGPTITIDYFSYVIWTWPCKNSGWVLSLVCKFMRSASTPDATPERKIQILNVSWVEPDNSRVGGCHWPKGGGGQSTKGIGCCGPWLIWWVRGRAPQWPLW